MRLTNDFADVSDVVRGRRVGEQYEFKARNIPILLTLSALRESHGEVRGEVQAESTEFTPEVDNRGLLLRERFGLLSTRAKAGFAKSLNNHFPAPNIWGQVVEAICNAALDDFRLGAPFQVLADVEEVAERWLLNKFLVLCEPTLLYGDGGTGKSNTAMTTAVAVASGHNLPHFNLIGGPRAVLYLDWESSGRAQVSRMNRIAKGFGVEPPRNLYYRRMFQPLANDLRVVKQEVDNHSIGLVIVDSVALAQGDEAEKSKGILQLFNALAELGEASKLLIAHLSKEDAKADAIGLPYGSIFNRNSARSAWAVKASTMDEEDYLSIGLYHRKVNEGRLFQPVGLRYTFWNDRITVEGFDINENPELAGKGPLHRRIRPLLAEGPQTAEEIAERLGAEEGSVSKALQRMPDVHTLEKGGGRGKKAMWVLTEKGIEPDEEAEKWPF